MPSVHSQSSTLLQNGPTVPVHIWLGRSDIEALEAAGQPVPQPIQIVALIDTGALQLVLHRKS